MAIRSVGSVASANTTGLASKEITRVINQPDPDVWVRNPSWPPCDANVGDKKIVALHAVWPTTGNFVAVSASGGSYTVDWGDGTVTNYTSGTANYEFSYSAAALVGTEAPVTLNASTDTVDRTAHGYTNGMKVTLYSVAGTSAVTSGRPYFVINATANTFQVSLTSGGSAIAFGTNGTANLLPYRVATVTITPQAGQVVNTFNIDVKNNSVSLLQAYASGWLDMTVAWSDLTSLVLNRNSGVLGACMIERVRVKELSPSLNSMTTMFSSQRNLRKVEITTNTSSVTSVSGMFSSCNSLTEVNLFDTSTVSNFSNMFQSCSSLRRVPAFNTSSANNFSNMFQSCSALLEVPSFNGSSVTSCSGMFQNCSSLVTAPAINFTASLTNAGSMFSGCRSLKNVPLYNFQAVTSATSMFNNCVSLEAVPAFNLQYVTNASSMFTNCKMLQNVQLITSSVLTSVQSMFNGCSSLVEAPLFNTSGVTDASGMFSSCEALARVPSYNFSSVTTVAAMFSGCLALIEAPELTFGTALASMNTMFSGCTSLIKCPAYNTPNVTNTSSMFQTCSNLLEAPMMDTSKVTTTSNMFNGCSNLTYVPLYDLGLATTMNSMFSSCTSLDNIPTFNISASTNTSNMFSSCTSLSEIPAMNFNSVTSSALFTSMLNGCASLARFRGINTRYGFNISGCKMSKSALEEVFSILPGVTPSQTMAVNNNYGVGTQTSKSNTSTAGSTVVTMGDTSQLLVGMCVTGNNTAITTTVTGVVDVSADTVTRTAHGLANGTKVSFTSLGLVTGVTIMTIYYVVNATTDTFQVATTVGGSAIDFTGTGGAVTIRYPSYVVSIVPNTSVTLDTPAAASGTATWTYRVLDVSDAILKNWSIST